MGLEMFQNVSLEPFWDHILAWRWKCFKIPPENGAPVEVKPPSVTNPISESVVSYILELSQKAIWCDTFVKVESRRPPKMELPPR